MAKLIFITGGTRSGKSSHALELAESIGSRRLFIATCPSVDPEMTARVQRHKEEREGRGWTTIECETELEIIFSQQLFGYDVVLLDCVTLWINNILYNFSRTGKVVDDMFIAQLCEKWLKLTDGYAGSVVCVSNEVGLGVVPDNPLARKYRDLVGTCNQIIGKKADEVIMVSCGIPLHLKAISSLNK